MPIGRTALLRGCSLNREVGTLQENVLAGQRIASTLKKIAGPPVFTLGFFIFVTYDNK